MAEPDRLLAELWYAEVPDLTAPRLLAALRDIAPEAELQDGSLTVPHPHLSQQAEGRAVPLLTAVLPGSRLDDPAKSLPDVSQTWDWAEAETAVDGCTGSVLVSELLADLFTPQQRVSGLMSVLRVLIEQTRPQALYWPHSQRVTDPARFDPDSLDGVINVRYFAVGDGDARVMDTLGLDLFGVSDVQCHYRGADPGQVANLLFTTAVYLFTEGDVIDDGHTISGLDDDDQLVCRHERSLLPPARTVLDVDLGPYAAGRPT